MPDPIDLTVRNIPETLSTALQRERPLTVAVVDSDGIPQVSFRGSTHVRSSDQLALWARKRDDGLAVDVAAHPNVMLAYYDPEGAAGPGATGSPRMLLITGRAHVDESANEEVWAAIPQAERDRDKDKQGVAIIVDVDTVAFGGRGISQSRE